MIVDQILRHTPHLKNSISKAFTDAVSAITTTTSVQPIAASRSTTSARLSNCVAKFLGATGHLPPKHARKVGTALQSASLAFVHGPPPAGGGTWTADCSFDDLCRVMGRSWVGNAQTPGEAAKAWINSHVVYPNHETKVQVATYYIGSSIAQTMRKGAIVLGRTNETNVLTSALIVSEYQQNDDDDDDVQPVDGTSTGSSSWADTLWEFGVTFRLIRLVIPDLLSCSVYQEQQDVSSVKAAMLSGIKQGYHDQNRPSTGYWNVEMVAIDPDCQGQGHGNEIMNRLCMLADAAGVQCHLEAAGAKNARFYQRSGFVVAKKLQIRDPTNSEGPNLEVSLMVREPKIVPPIG